MTIDLVPPGVLYGQRTNQVDLRFTKSFRTGTKRAQRKFWHLQCIEREPGTGDRQYVRTELAAAGGDSARTPVQVQRPAELL